MSRKEFFPDVKKIEYNPNASKSDVMVFRHYNADEIVLGKTMKEWLRFSVCFWHSFCWEGNDPFGNATFKREWNTHLDELERAKDKIRAAFELFSKLGNPYYAFHDRDVSPEGANLVETNKNLDEIIQRGVKV